MAAMRARSSRGTERLGEVIIGAGLEPDQGVQFLGTGREHHDVGIRELADLPGHLKAVDVRQAKIQGDDVRIQGLGSQYALGAAAGHSHLKAGLGQDSTDQFANVVVILDDQTHTCITHSAPSAADVRSIAGCGYPAAMALLTLPRQLPRND
jgi:hypothetical protein